mmetsp:Transcript_4035/g.8270  ORF Transcript_4035/g.8270 Transcript_4035/m.8270 type:complete len:93 (+) Transcript_4035:900-1178(+)
MVTPPSAVATRHPHSTFDVIVSPPGARSPAPSGASPPPQHQFLFSLHDSPLAPMKRASHSISSLLASTKRAPHSMTQQGNSSRPFPDPPSMD